MITGTVDTATPTPSGLVLGVVLRDQGGVWIRFLALEVPWKLLTSELVMTCAKYAAEARSPVQHDEPLW
jgi:hypothetical protein